MVLVVVVFSLVSAWISECCTRRRVTREQQLKQAWDAMLGSRGASSGRGNRGTVSVGAGTEEQESVYTEIQVRKIGKTAKN